MVYNLPTPIVTQTAVTFGDPEVVISGQSSDGTRTMTVTIPYFDQNGQRISTDSVTYSGVDFNAAYDAYASDQQLIAYSADSANIPPVAVAEIPPDANGLNPS